MELRTFALSVLLGDTMEAKLLRPGPVTDEAPGPAMDHAPSFPGRPAALMPRRGPPVPFPQRGALEHPEARAAAVHAFANHELLAIEVMALTLLRFPDAPAAFRQDILRTLVEEQRHLRQYLARMETWGVRFGDHAVNDWFWRCAADLRSPIDHVVRMSMTFEQANLDFAASYMAAFADVGDEETAEVLASVLRDEIRHVAVGVQWFDHWRTTPADRFDAWRRELPDTLSPVRAKGTPFRRDVRVSAGFADSDIDALAVFTWDQAQGATLWHANLDIESTQHGEVLSRAARDVTEDLAPCVGLLARPGDVLVVPRLPDRAYVRAMHDAGLRLPHHVVHAQDAPVPLWRAQAWAPTPDWAAAHDALPHPAPHSLAAFSKALAPDLLRSAFGAVDAPDRWFGALEPGVEVATTAALQQAAHQLPGRDLWLKRLWSTAGRGHLRVKAPQAAAADWPVGLLESLARGEAWLMEPSYERILDLSMLQEHTGGDMVLTRSLTSARGQYLGHVVGDPWRGLPSSLRRELLSPRDGISLRQVMDQACQAVFAEARRRFDLEGPLGIDMFVFRGPDGVAYLRPVVELNPRYTMGFVARALSRQIHPTAHARWLILPKGKTDAARLTLTPRRHAGSGLWLDGCVPTADPGSCRRVVPVLVVGRDASALRATMNQLGVPYS